MAEGRHVRLASFRERGERREKSAPAHGAGEGAAGASASPAKPPKVPKAPKASKAPKPPKQPKASRAPRDTHAPHFAKKPAPNRFRPPEGPRLFGRSLRALIPVALAAIAVVVLAVVLWPKGTPTPSAATGTDRELLSLSAQVPQALAKEAGVVLEADAALNATMEELAQDGVEAGYYVATLSGQELFSRNADETFYAASAIKGPFVLATFPDGVPAGLQGLVEDAIKWSSNESYWSLRNIADTGAIAGQLQAMGVDELSATQSFVHLTPRQLATLWVNNANVLLSESDGARWLRGVFESPDNAPIAALSEGSYSKGGWIATESLHCTVDAGIVAHGQNRYIMAVMIDAGEDQERLTKLVAAVDTLEQALYALNPTD